MLRTDQVNVNTNRYYLDTGNVWKFILETSSST